MKLLIMSDSHGNFPAALRAIQLTEPIDAIVHLGDGSDDAELISFTATCEVIRLAGNCDAGSRSPREAVREMAGKRFLLTHGDRYGIKNGFERLEKRAIDAGADIVLFGHTHRAEIIEKAGMLLVNPGTLMKGSNFLSVAVMEIAADGGVACTIVELD